MAHKIDVHAENLIIALRMAIREQSERERNVYKYTTYSALVAGWCEVLKALEEGRELNIKHPKQ